MSVLQIELDMKINKRLLLRIAVPAVLLFLCVFALIKYNELVIYNNADIFEHEYPTAKQISDYLSDATIVGSYDMSKPFASRHVYQNMIVYLDADYHYYQWRSAGNINLFDAGSWSTYVRFMISKLHGERRYQWVQVFCLHSNYKEPVEQINNCQIAYKPAPYFLTRAKQYDYKKGKRVQHFRGSQVAFQNSE
jgi:hypothetical protein